MTVAELLARISSRELREWQILEGIEPFGETRADLRMAILATVIAEQQRDRKQRPRPYTPEDFMPRFDPPEEKDPHALFQTMELWASALGQAG